MKEEMCGAQNPRCAQCTKTCKEMVATMDGDRVGVLIAQLGTPDAPTPQALRRYLKEFLADPRVIELNRILWWIILNCIILVFRPKRSARLYKRIWTEDGSPLLSISRRKVAELSKLLPDCEIALGMRYGSPSLASAIDSLISKGCRSIVLFPEYPQYSASTTGSTYDAVYERLLKERWVPTLRVVEPYYKSEQYLDALANSINRQLQEISNKPERLILSYHGIPQRYSRNGDPYCCMCIETTNLLRPRINLPADRIIHCFQSRFGKEPWLQPYTDETIERLAKEGVKTIAVACPGFVVDCLETIDEIGTEAEELFKEHGGEHLHALTCLNNEEQWLKGCAELIKSCWPQQRELSIKEVEDCSMRDVV